MFFLLDWILSIFCSLFSIGCPRPPSTVIPSTPVVLPTPDALEHVKLGIAYPPVQDDEQRAFSLPILQELDVQDIRFNEEWAFRQPTEGGSFAWSPLDERLAWASANGIQVLLTVSSNGPDWACSEIRNERSCVYNNNQDFQNYIEQLLQRYPNQIYRIQFGNEWQSDFWYVGTAQEFVAANNIVSDAIAAYSPMTQQVLGGFTSISLRFLAGCNGFVDSFYDDEGTFFDRAFLDANCDDPAFQEVFDRIDYILENANFDLLDIHLYDDFENWSAYYMNIQASLSEKNKGDVPIIVSEFGGPNLNLESSDESYQAERLGGYIQAVDDLGVASAYFFRLIEGSQNQAHRLSGLLRTPSLAKKPSFDFFKAYSTAA